MASIIGVMAIMGVASASLNPAVNSLASKRTPPEEQGRVMGIVGAYNSLGRIFGPVVGGALFDALGYRSPYVFGSLLFFVIYLISFKLFAHQRAKQAHTHPSLHLEPHAEPTAAPGD
jgi:DHA1 family tetracycline resistance protein-like MFS transporter